VRTRGLLRDGSPSAIALWLPLVLDGPLAYAEVSSRLVEQPVVRRALGPSAGHACAASRP
jgi:hypothetical protein